MLTLEMILALFHGVPAGHLDHLDRAWYLLAVRIERGLKEGKDPLAALHAALIHSTQWERDAYLRALQQEEPVLALPDLTQRQKEALIALRYSGACSLSQLSRILAQDKGNTSRRLDVLIQKGYALKYFRHNGPYFLAITRPLAPETRSQVAELMQSFKQALLDRQAQQPEDVAHPVQPGSNSNASPLLRRKGSGVRGAAPSTQSTTPTTPTMTTTPTTDTAATTPKTATTDIPATTPTTHHLSRPP